MIVLHCLEPCHFGWGEAGCMKVVVESMCVCCFLMIAFNLWFLCVNIAQAHGDWIVLVPLFIVLSNGCSVTWLRWHWYRDVPWTIQMIVLSLEHYFVIFWCSFNVLVEINIAVILHNCPMNVSDALFRCGRIIACWAASESEEWGRQWNLPPGVGE